MEQKIFYKDAIIWLDNKGFESLQNAFKLIVSGGGLVINPKNEILLIFRNGFWDLPKGCCEDNENLKNCAIREISEETGLSSIEIIEHLQDTFHIYCDAKNEIILKKCVWYFIKTNSEQPLCPQLEEGISEAIWCPIDQIDNYKSKMFPSVVDCMDLFFSKYCK